MKFVLSKHKGFRLFVNQINVENSKVIIRIDDFPTGIRPIKEDRRSQQEIIKLIDETGIPYILAIVPTICVEEDFVFLRKLKNLIPAMHGINHGYANFSTMCEFNNDPKNEITMLKPFNELSGIRHKYIVSCLVAHREKLAKQIGKKVVIYIPPTNRVNIFQIFKIYKAGFHQILFDRKLYRFLIRFPLMNSAFYGISSNYNNQEGIITLHLTWEQDIYEKFGDSSLRNLLTNVARINSESITLT